MTYLVTPLDVLHDLGSSEEELCHPADKDIVQPALVTGLTRSATNALPWLLPSTKQDAVRQGTQIGVGCWATVSMGILSTSAGPHRLAGQRTHRCYQGKQELEASSHQDVAARGGTRPSLFTSPTASSPCLALGFSYHGIFLGS